MNDVQQDGAANGNGHDRARRLDFAMRALSRTPVSIYYQNDALVYEWAENVPRDIFPDGIEGKIEADLFPRLAAERLVAVKQKVLATGEPYRFEMPINFDGDVRWFDLWIDPERDQRGGVVGLFSTAIETTDQKRREVQLKNLLREVSHRSKNLLAIILSLASQTARSATSVPGFLTAFSGRLQAISRAQDLITDRDWRGALMSELIERQVALFRGARMRPVTIRGDDLVLSPNAALYVGLALHELCAHAVHTRKASAAAEATIAVTTTVLPVNGGDRIVRLEWVEAGAGTGGDVPVEALSRAFLENVVPLAVDGKAELETGPEGLSYRIDIAGTHIA